MGITTHGLAYKEYKSKNRITRWPVYHSWVNMRQRCSNAGNPDYRFYGGRGIKYCRRWDKFENFLEDMGHPALGLTLDRIDNDGDYEPSNCRWASRKEQARNRSTCAQITYKGVTKPVGVWADEIPLDIKAKNLYKRIFDRGWDVERAFTQPLKKQ